MRKVIYMGTLLFQLVYWLAAGCGNKVNRADSLREWVNRWQNDIWIFNCGPSEVGTRQKVIEEIIDILMRHKIKIRVQIQLPALGRYLDKITLINQPITTGNPPDVIVQDIQFCCSAGWSAANNNCKSRKYILKRAFLMNFIRNYGIQWVRRGDAYAVPFNTNTQSDFLQ